MAETESLSDVSRSLLADTLGLPAAPVVEAIPVAPQSWQPGQRPPGAAPLFKPGETGNPERKGYDKITSRNIRAAVCEALTRVGGVEFLTRCARRSPRAFLSLLARLIPQRVEVESTEIPYTVLLQQLQEARDSAGLPVIDAEATPALPQQAEGEPVSMTGGGYHP